MSAHRDMFENKNQFGNEIACNLIWEAQNNSFYFYCNGIEGFKINLRGFFFFFSEMSARQNRFQNRK